MNVIACRFALIAFLLLSLASHGIETISCSFGPGQVLPKELKLGRDWRLADEVLRNDDVKGKGFMHSFHLRPELSWQDFELSFKLRTLGVTQKDHHVGLVFQSSSTFCQLYCRGDRFLILQPAVKRHDALGTDFPKSLPVGKDASWSDVRILAKGNRLTVSLNGQAMGGIDTFASDVNDIRFYAYNTQVELDDLRVVIYQTAPKRGEARKASPNLALNSSFETCTLDELPDFWGVPHWGMTVQRWILNHAQWHRCFKTDSSTAWHGKRSMRIENPDSGPISEGLVLTSCNFGTEPGKTYTLSATMKADRPGVKVMMFNQPRSAPYARVHERYGWGEKTVELTTEWKRYSCTYTRTGNSLYTDMIRFALLNRGVVWIDAVQLEPGDMATDYQPAEAERTLTVHEGNVEKELLVVPIHPTQQLEQTPVLDGKLDDPVWSLVQAVELKSLSGQGVKEGTRARFFYTQGGIYLGIDAEEATSDRIICAKRQRDDYVWCDPSFEIFVDSKLTRGTYHHLCFNADGIQYDANMGDTRWNGTWQVKTARKSDHTGWTAEVFLPFSDFEIDSSNGSHWGFNLCRNNIRLGEYSVWAPTYGGFHAPLRFGQLVLSPAVQRQYHVSADEPLLRYLGAGQNDLSLKLFNDTGIRQTLTLRVRLFNTRTSAPAGDYEKTVELADHVSRRVSLGALSCQPSDEFQAEIEIIAGDRILHSSCEAVTAAKILTAQVQYDYYTREREMLVQGQVELSAALLERLKLDLSIVNQAGDCVYHDLKGMSGVTFRYLLPVSSWSDGDYRMRARLVDAGGKVIATASHGFQKLPPGDHEVKIDRLRRMVTVNGRLFFPLGFFWEGALSPELVEYLGRSGVTAIHTYNYKELLSNPAILRAGERHGVMFQVDVAARKGELAKAITGLKHHANILAWYTYDEAFTTKWGRKHYAEIVRSIAEGQKLDPYHPVILLENRYGMDYVLEKKIPFPGKIPIVDVYAYPPSANVQVVDSSSQRILKCGEENGSPGWFVPFASGYAFHASRDMTMPEHEYMAYVCVINGIRGLLYWAAYPKAPSSFPTLMRIFREIKSLQAVLCSLEPSPQVTCNSNHVRFMLKRHDGCVYLIAVNDSRTKLQARFDLSGIPEARHAEVLFESRGISVRNQCLEDSFEGLRRHVYRIR